MVSFHPASPYWHLLRTNNGSVNELRLVVEHLVAMLIVGNHGSRRHHGYEVHCVVIHAKTTHSTPEHIDDAQYLWQQVKIYFRCKSYE